MNQAVLQKRELPAHTGFHEEVIAGLSLTRKSLPGKYLYDAAGLLLFERICELEGYYLTRTELEIMARHLPEMAQSIGRQARLLEPGAGTSAKAELLLAAAERPEAYSPIDISTSALDECAKHISARFPGIAIQPICADYTDAALLERLTKTGPYIIFFPGSALGNFETMEAQAFLSRLRRLTGNDGGILLGADLMKDEQFLQAAYDDDQGISAAFNKNILARINRELGGDFNLEAFTYKAVVNQRLQRVEMQLVSQTAQKLRIGDKLFHFNAGESIHTGYAHKYTLPGLHMLAQVAGLRICQSWVDDKQRYSMHYLKAV